MNEASTRNLSDNISDLKGQTATKDKDKELMAGLIKEYSLKVVQAYMHHIQKNAEQAVREMLQKIHKEYKEKNQSQRLGINKQYVSIVNFDGFSMNYIQNKRKMKLNKNWIQTQQNYMLKIIWMMEQKYVLQ